MIESQPDQDNSFLGVFTPNLKRVNKLLLATMRFTDPLCGIDVPEIDL
jgi:hypothetical protein